MRFAIYEDSRCWKYKVMPGLGGSSFKARYHKPDKTENVGWKCMARLPWRSTAEEAQKDLDNIAIEKRWKTVGEQQWKTSR